MQLSPQTFPTDLPDLMRRAMLRLLTGLVVELPPDTVRARIAALPMGDQLVLAGAAGLGLLVATLLFAHAGPGGPVAMWVTLWLVVR